MGAGGNAAMESAAVLANSLEKIASKIPSLDLVRQALKEFYENRHFRANSTCEAANKLTRVEALKTFPDEVMGLYVIPRLGDYLADATCDALVGAETLHCLPMPERARNATMPWDTKSGVGNHESRLKRTLYALPLLGLTYYCSRTMGTTIAQISPMLQLSSQTGEALIGGSGALTSIVTKYYGVAWLDRLLAKLVTAFTPTLAGFDAAHRSQMFTFLADMAPLQAIFAIESLRRGNFVTVAHLL
jgi:hypothetical protein